MATIQRNNLFYLRLFVSLALLSCISPAPDVLTGKPSTFASALSSTVGELKLVIWKSRYTLTLYKGDLPVKTYHAVFGRGYQDGDKRMVGDKRTPEGDFYICTMNHSKRFYKFMGLSYPGLKHAEYGVQSKLISPAEYASIKSRSANAGPRRGTRGSEGLSASTGGSSTERFHRARFFP